MPSSCYFSEVMHKRLQPFEYQFKYGVFSLRVDIDTIGQEAENLKWLSLNRFNLISLNAFDFGDRSGRNWRHWVNELLAEYGIETAPERVELVCFPKMLGMSFNPLAVWYAYNKQNQLIAIIGEVSNTFGQWHHYVLTNQGKPIDEQFSQSIQSVADKDFHVSPFISMDCQYKFRFFQPNERYRLIIEQSENEKPTLIATQNGLEASLNDKALLKAFFKFPLHAIKILGMIHWWALRIWLKGGKYHKPPTLLKDTKHSHSEMTLC